MNLEAHPTGNLVTDPWVVHVDHDMSTAIPQWFLDEQVEIKARFMEFVEEEIKEIRQSSKYNGSLDLQGTQITALPEGLHVGGSLDLRGTKITALPEGLHVGGSLDLRGTKIKRNSVPKELIDNCVFD